MDDSEATFYLEELIGKLEAHMPEPCGRFVKTVGHIDFLCPQFESNCIELEGKEFDEAMFLKCLEDGLIPYGLIIRDCDGKKYVVVGKRLEAE